MKITLDITNTGYTINLFANKDYHPFDNPTHSISCIIVQPLKPEDIDIILAHTRSMINRGLNHRPMIIDNSPKTPCVYILECGHTITSIGKYQKSQKKKFIDCKYTCSICNNPKRIVNVH